MKPTASIVPLIFLLFSCTQVKHPVYSLRDSVLNEYFTYHDSTLYWDTTDLNFKMLKAYQKNDTTFFKSLHADVKESRRYRQQWMSSDSCVHQPSIEALQADEAYRFKYSASLCPYATIITIIRINHEISLNAIVIDGQWQDSSACNVIEMYNKKLSQKDINDLNEALEYADFWALKCIETITGYDGDNLTIDGYIREAPSYNRQPKRNVVYRWGISRLALNKALALILKLADIKEKCLLEN